MHFRSVAIIVVGCASLLASHTVNAASCTLGQDVNKAGMLDMHNQARALCGGSAKGVNPLSWDDDLACASQAWANRCVWKHSGTSGVGENIASGFGNNYGIEQAIQSWYEEIWDYKNGMGFTEATGHATQMVWKDTRKVGCGVARCKASQLGLSTGSETAQYVVCQYSPPGNVVGLPDGFSKEVFTPKDRTQITLSSSADKSSGSSGSSGSSSSGGNSDTNAGTTKKSSNRRKKIVTTSTGKAQTKSKIFRAASYAELMAWVKQQASKGLVVKWKWYGDSKLTNKKRSMQDEARLTPAEQKRSTTHNSQKGVPLSHRDLTSSQLSRRKLHRKQKRVI